MGIKLIKDGDVFEIQMFNDLTDIRILRHSIDQWLEEMDNVSAFKIFSTKLCLEEAVYNAMIHGYENYSGKEKIVDIRVQKEGNLINLQIKDYGPKEWFKNYTIPHTVPLENLKANSGRGLIIIKALAYNCKITNAHNQGTTVDISIKLDDED